jgi:hypothetical protein
MNIKNQLTIFTLSLVFCHFAWSAERSEITVVVDGLGKTANDAAQNATENALKQVVGSFVDTETILEKQTAINGSIRTESKQITSQTREFSQGSVKSFEVVTTSTENGIFRIAAKVTVRLEYFKEYIKKTAFDEKNIDESLFAEIATNQKQKENKAAVLFDAVLMPLVNGEALRFSIKKPISADNARDSDETMRRIMRIFDRKLTKDDGRIMYWGNQIKISIVVPVKITIDDAFLSNSKKNLMRLPLKKRLVA